MAWAIKVSAKSNISQKNPIQHGMNTIHKSIRNFQKSTRKKINDHSPTDK